MHNAADLAKASLTLPSERSSAGGSQNPPNPPVATSSHSEPPLPPNVLAELWTRMLAIYGYRWESAYGQTPDGVAARTWSAGLRGITSRQVADGLNDCLISADPWPPTLPAFRAMCLGIPALIDVREELLSRGTRRSGFTRLVWQFIDGYLFARASQRDADRMLEKAYAKARRHVMAGGAVPEPSPAIAPPKPAGYVEPAPESVAEHERRIREALGQRAEPPPPVDDEDPSRYSATELEALDAELKRQRQERQAAVDRKSAAAGDDRDDDEFPPGWGYDPHCGPSESTANEDHPTGETP